MWTAAVGVPLVNVAVDCTKLQLITAVIARAPIPQARVFRLVFIALMVFLLRLRRRDLHSAFHRRLGVIYDYITTLVSRPITKYSSRRSFRGSWRLCRLVGGGESKKGWNPGVERRRGSEVEGCPDGYFTY